MAWFGSIVASTAAVGLATGSVMLARGSRFIKEFTRPGVTVDQATPQWGGWTFPEAVVEPPTALRRAVTFQKAGRHTAVFFRRPLVPKPKRTRQQFTTEFLAS